MRNAILALALIVPTAAYAASFDGKWAYELHNEGSAPVCRGFGGGKLEIRDGRLSGYIHHRQAGSFEVTGEVKEDGSAVFVARGYDTVDFSGQINGNHGEGVWKSRLESDCRGTWELTRS